jgi:hypothetical protein
MDRAGYAGQASSVPRSFGALHEWPMLAPRPCPNVFMSLGLEALELTDDDLDQIAGKRDQLEGKIQEHYGIERDRARRDIDDWYGNQTW